MDKNDSNASGALQRSMELDKITIDTDKMSITIELEDYWYYVDMVEDLVRCPRLNLLLIGLKVNQ